MLILSSPLRRFEVLQEVTSVSEESTACIFFNPENRSGMFLLNSGNHLHGATTQDVYRK
jgi:hypothetical protein